MFQSLSGLTLCCDQPITPQIPTNMIEFQSLSGLTLCCDKRAKGCKKSCVVVSIPFRADAVL